MTGGFPVTGVTTVTTKRHIPSLWVAQIVRVGARTLLCESARGDALEIGYSGYHGYAPPAKPSRWRPKSSRRRAYDLSTLTRGRRALREVTGPKERSKS
jgi:hypothetical protein